MSLADNTEDVDFLHRYLDEIKPAYGAISMAPSNLLSRVTILSYFFRPQNQCSTYFPYLEKALMCTWRFCGKLNTVIVTNGKNSLLDCFAQKHTHVSIQVESSLMPGCVDSMSVDCNSKLCSRFDTDYVLVVQDDGFPIRFGLDAFIGKCDYIGAPWRRPNVLGLCAGYLSRRWPANGGFSLRSKRFCTLVSQYWEHYYSDKPFDKGRFQEDVFCTVTLPTEHHAFSRQIRWANSRFAAAFSYDSSVPSNIVRKPFGFHGAKAFAELYRAGLMDLSSCHDNLNGI